MKKQEIEKCCEKPMEAKGMSLNPANGCGFCGYGVLFQCKKCGRIKIINIQDYGGDR